MNGLIIQLDDNRKVWDTPQAQSTLYAENIRTDRGEPTRSYIRLHEQGEFRDNRRPCGGWSVHAKNLVSMKGGGNPMGTFSTMRT